MTSETYTPGHTQNAVDFMTQRTFETHGGFIEPYLKPGMTVLDCGCGPGTITLGMARAVAPGCVTGIDFGESQIERARSNTHQAGLTNVEFKHASVYQLPLPDNSFDAVFSHALLEHLSEPAAALAEFHRVLKPGGLAAVCSPDWHGFLLTPPSEALDQAIAAYKQLQLANGGDVYVGAKFGTLMEQIGFEQIHMSARYECYESLEFIGNYLALQLEQSGQAVHARTLRTWSQSTVGMFAQCWVSCVGRAKL